MDYVVAIPTYARVKALTTKTLPTLDRMKCDRDKIHIFVANEEEREKYDAALNGEYRLIVGVKGISRQRKFYHEWFPADTKIVSIDDDVEDVLQKQDNRMVPTTYTLDALAEEAYGYCEQVGARLWGLHHGTNAFYMKNEIWAGLRYCAATLMGTYAHDWIFCDPNRRMTNTGEDHHSSLRGFVRYGANIRFEYLGFKQDWFGEGGNAQCVAEEDGVERNIRHRDELLKVHEQYADLCKVIYHEDTGITALRLKPITVQKFPRKHY